MANIENHMVVGNRDKKPLMCPDCCELATGQFVERVAWCQQSEEINPDCIKCPICPGPQCGEAIDAHECVCGCIFNDEGKKIGTR